MRLIDRRERMVLNGSEYELTLLWNRENIRRCCLGMCPDYAYIRKNGKKFADIECYSNMTGFTIENFHLTLVKPEWKVVVHTDDINTIPFKALLAKLPNL